MGLIWVNKEKARKIVKRAWTAFNNHEYGKLSGHDTIQECLVNWETFAESMADIAWMLGIRDLESPSAWDDC